MAKDRFNQVLIRLADASDSNSVPLAADLASKWLWLRAAVTMNRAEVIGNFVDKDRRASGVVPQWPSPQPGSPIRVEVATELPVFIPNRQGQWEFELEAGNRTMLVANRMVRCRYRPKGRQVDAYTYTLAHHLHLAHMKTEADANVLFVEPMRTLVSMAFSIEQGNGTEEFERNFWGWSERLLQAANSVLDAIRVYAKLEQDLHLNANSRPLFFVAAWASGAQSSDAIQVRQLVGNVYDTVLLPASDFADWPHVDQILAGQNQPRTHDVALARAKTFRRFGYLDLAVVQTCLAAESLLGNALEKLLKARGVSDDVLKSRIRDVSSLSLLLQLQANLLLDVSTDTKAVAALKALDWARECRNKVVHRGGDPRSIDKERLRDAIEAVAYLASALAAMPESNAPEVQAQC